MLYWDYVSDITDVFVGQTKKQVAVVFIIAAVVALIAALVWGFVCRAIVRGKGYPDQMNHGFAWGFWLGLIGLIVCACKQNYTQNNFNGQPPYGGQPYNGQPPYGGQPYNGQPYGGQQQFNGQPNGQPNAPQGGNTWYCSCGEMNQGYETVCHLCGAPRQN